MSTAMRVVQAIGLAVLVVGGAALAAGARRAAGVFQALQLEKTARLVSLIALAPHPAIP